MTRERYESLAIADLKEIAKSRGIKGTSKMSKGSLMAAVTIGAAIDDGILNVGFRVLSFETVFFDNLGNAKPLASDGASFSAVQRDQFRRLVRGRRFYISNIIVMGPDGIERTLPTAMEIKVQ